MADMDIRLSAQLTPEDYFQAQRLHQGLRILLILGACMLIALLVVTIRAHDPYWWQITIVIWVGWFLLFKFMQPRSLARRCRKTFAQQKALQVPYQMELTDNEYRAQSELGNSHIPWSSFYKWKANSLLVLVYQSDRIFHMFPRRFFASDDDYQDFQNVLLRKIGPPNKGRKPEGSS
jgi:hypothetical protein